MEDAPKEGGLWAEEWVPRDLVAYLLASYSVIMGGECEGLSRCGLEVGLCGSFYKDATSAAECNILEVEKCVVGLGAGVISRAEEEELCDYDHVVFGPEDRFTRSSGKT